MNLLPIVNAAVIVLPADRAAEALAALRSRPEVAEIHVDAAISAEGLAVSEGIAGTLVTPTNPAPVVDGYRWNLRQIDLNEVSGGVRGREVQVAVLDTDLDAAHPAFSGAVLGGYNARAGEVETDYLDRNGHGTHVAGIIAARFQDQQAQPGRGMAPEARLYAVRVLDAQGGDSCPTSSTA